MAVTFNSLTFLKPDLIESLKKLGYTECSKIQEKAIPNISKNNKDAIYLAPTGTGKTLSFLIPIFNDIDKEQGLNAIVVVPTAILGMQIYDVAQSIKSVYDKDLSITLLKNENDLKNYKTTANILIITPKIIDKVLKEYNTNNLKRVIVDEADMIAFDGFIEELYLLKNLITCPLSLFSASLNEHEVTTLKKIISSNEVIDVRGNNLTALNINHYLVDIKSLSETDALIEFVNNYLTTSHKIIVFISNKQKLNAFSRQLNSKNYEHILLNGNNNDRELKNALYDFKNGDKKILLCSDSVSRGIDISQIDAVISIDLPSDLTYYYHRAGRSGRFNTKGDSYIFVTDFTRKKIADLEKRNFKFQYISYTKNGFIKKNKSKLHVSTHKSNTNELLEQEIRKTVHKLRSTKVKPNYKKKVKRAVERLKKKHKEKIIDTNLRKKRIENEKNRDSFR